ncbi:MAG: cell cycle transcriptional regulator TrcR [Pseudomonadota bacterium]
MSELPLMPKATAVWLVDNTALSFAQIAKFCALHPLEVKAIADGEAAQGIKGLDPLQTGQLTREQITEAENNPEIALKVQPAKTQVATSSKKRGPRYTPVSRRHDRPNAILWLLRNHKELKDAQIIRLVGTTKTTIEAIRSGSHWNAANLTPMDPVTLGLCKQIELDLEVEKASRGSVPKVEPTGPVLLSAEEALAARGGDDTEATTTGEDASIEDVFGVQPDATPDEEAAETSDEDLDAESVFAKLKELKIDDRERADDET